MATSKIQLTDDLKSIFRETAQQLKGSERRQFMAKVVSWTLGKEAFKTAKSLI